MWMWMEWIYAGRGLPLWWVHMVGSELIKVENEFSFKITCQIQEGKKKKKTYRARLWGKSWPTEPFSNLPTIRPGRKSFPVQSWKEGRWMIPHLDRTRKSIPTNTVYASSKTPLFLLQICTQIVLRYHSREDFQLILIKAVAYQSWRLCNSQRQFDQIGWEHLVIWWPAFGVNISHYNL